MRKGKIIAAAAFFAVLAALIVSGAVILLIRHSGALMLRFGEWFGIDALREFTGVFDQLKNAQIRIPVVTLLLLSSVLSAGSCMALSRYSGKRKGMFSVVCILLSFVLLLVLFVLTLLFTDVNSIRFGSALKAVSEFL